MRFLAFGLLFLTAVYVSESSTLFKRKTVEIEKLSGSFYDDVDVNNEKVLKQVGQIYDNAKSAIETLSKSGKKELVNGLEKTIAFIKSIDEKVKAMNPTTDGGKLLVQLVEKLIKTGEDIMEADLKKAQGSYYEDANKEALMKDVKNILDEVKSVFEKLAKTDKKLLVERMTKLVAFVKEIQTGLKTLHPTTDVGKVVIEGVEKMVDEIEGFLEKQVKSLSGKFYDETTKDDLMNQLDNLKKQAQEAIQKLLGQGKTVLAEEVKKVEAHLVALEAQLEELNPQSDTGKTLLKVLETLIKATETKLEEEIKKLSGSFYEDTQDELKKQVENLKKQAQEAIEKLKAQGKTALAEGIKKLEANLVDLESQLEKLNPQTEVGKTLLKSVETLVKAAETKLEEEIEKLSGSFYADVDIYYDDDHKTILLKGVSDLYDKTAEAITTLTKKGDKKELVNGLEKAIKFIQSIGVKAKALKPTTESGKSVQKLLVTMAEQGEVLLNADLKKAQTGYYADVEKEALLKIVGQIYDEGKAALEKLAKTDKKALVDGLTKTIALVEEVQKELKTLNPSTDLGKVILDGTEKVVAGIDAFLKEDLKTASVPAQ